MERAVHYDGLSRELADALEARSRELAMEALRTLNREANLACETDAGGSWRWNCGIYVFQEEMPAEDETAPAKDAEAPRQDAPRPETPRSGTRSPGTRSQGTALAPRRGAARKPKDAP